MGGCPHHQPSFTIQSCVVLHETGSEAFIRRSCLFDHWTLPKLKGCKSKALGPTPDEFFNEEAKSLQKGGADLLILATNTMHKLADEMMEGVSIPIIHIADATARAIQSADLQRPGLMATAFTMEQMFYTDRLKSMGLMPVIPNQSDREETHRIIYEELCKRLNYRRQ